MRSGELYSKPDPNTLMHYGTKHRSGRYEYGSGENPFQHEPWFPGFGKGEKTFKDYVEECRKKGMSDTEIAEACDLRDKFGNPSVSLLTKQYSISRANSVQRTKEEARKLYSEGWSKTEIAKKYGKNESTIRGWLEEDNNKGAAVLRDTADKLKAAVDSKGMIQIGTGVEHELGVAQSKLNTAVQMLVNDGYVVQTIQVKQVGTGFKTNVKVLCPPDTTIRDVYKNIDKITTITEYKGDDTKSVLGLRKPEMVDLQRVYVKLAQDGGSEKDGLIEIKPGVEDIDMGAINYAQVRIAVSGTGADGKLYSDRYLKGVAVYGDPKDFPPGVDIIFNSSKSNIDKSLKPLKTMKDDEGNEKVDWDNPFGSSIKETLYSEEGLLKGGQSEYIGKDGKVHLSAVNKVNEEGDWGEWSKTLASQMLSKQPMPLIQRQLALSLAEKDSQLADIQAVVNPTLRKLFLEEFGDECSSAAVDLKAASLPRQASRVILPLNTLKENEIYAPGYRDGERVCLIRYPHQGIFEIPELVVNNRNKEGQQMMSTTPKDAVGINKATAEVLSGADFDGDTVVVIPVGRNVQIERSKPLTALIGFDNKAEYGGEKVDVILKKRSSGKIEEVEIYLNPKTGQTYERMSKRNKQLEMGVITNLITDMTMTGSATDDEMARATKHAQVIIDAEKHALDYKQSALDNGIGELKLKYQGGGGAGTIFSRAKSQARVPERTAFSDIDPETGKRIWKETGAYSKKMTYDPETGKKMFQDTDQLKTQKVTKMEATDDARTLLSGPNHEGTPKEIAYAEFANTLKRMGNESRKASLNVVENPVNRSAQKTFASEIASVTEKLAIAEKNKPRERQAQMYANVQIKLKIDDYGGEVDSETEKKIRNQALSSARAKFGAKKELIKFTDNEIKAINSDAFNKTTLKKVYENCDKDALKKQLMPNKRDVGLSDADISLIKSMKNSNYTLAEIADRLNVSTSTVSKYLS